MKKTTFIRVAWGIAFVLLLLVLARTFVGNVFHVDSRSMEPTIHGLEDGGEWVFVRYDQDPPLRNEIVVVQPASGGDPIVKRVLALPFERVQVLHGDVWVDDRVLRRVAGDAVARPFVRVFDERVLPLEKSFHMGSTQQNPWTKDGDAWRVDARSIPAGSDEGLMYLVPRLEDAYFGAKGELVRGDTTVNDAVLECEASCDGARGRLRFQLTEQGDMFELSIAPKEDGGALCLLTRRNEGSRLEELATAELARFALGAWHRVRFANVDDELVVDVDGARVFAHAYAGNEFHPVDERREGISIGARVLLGAEECVARFRGVRIERDLFYTGLGAHGTKAEARLGADELFLLGDNSAHSSDSRQFGPVPRSRLVGRAVAVVWPPSRWRRLE